MHRSRASCTSHSPLGFVVPGRELTLKLSLQVAKVPLRPPRIDLPMVRHTVPGAHEDRLQTQPQRPVPVLWYIRRRTGATGDLRGRLLAGLPQYESAREDEETA